MIRRLLSPPTSVEEKAQRRADLKARSTLLMALPNEHQLKFNSYKDAKTPMQAIKNRFGVIEQTYERLQKLISKLEMHGEVIPQEDINQKFLRNLSQEWTMHTESFVVELDGDYEMWKLRVEQYFQVQDYALWEVIYSNEDNTVNVHVNTASTNVSTASTNDSTASLSDATIYIFLANQSNVSQVVHDDLEQIHEDDLKEMDLKWQLALLSLKARKFYQRTGKKIIINGSDTTGYDKSKVEFFNCHKMGHFARECRDVRYEHVAMDLCETAGDRFGSSNLQIREDRPVIR
ncbi:putative ribonuclease H-like domain-containing protein [Tanacetum coccineum]|uniref:Ribonuclease H-like domain-containing protein n=1 Tax=Tanacetum coccineum TaxID=301880 RepID=A0ABQ5B1A8_9ASTR